MRSYRTRQWGCGVGLYYGLDLIISVCALQIERVVPREHDVENNAHRPHVHLLRNFGSLERFGWPVRCRSDFLLRRTSEPILIRLLIFLLNVAQSFEPSLR